MHMCSPWLFFHKWGDTVIPLNPTPSNLKPERLTGEYVSPYSTAPVFLHSGCSLLSLFLPESHASHRRNGELVVASLEFQAHFRVLGFRV